MHMTEKNMNFHLDTLHYTFTFQRLIKRFFIGDYAQILTPRPYFFEIFQKTDLNFSNFLKKYFSKNGQRLKSISREKD
jgi:hypothetical protein